VSDRHVFIITETTISRKAAEQLNPLSRLGQVNEVMRFCRRQRSVTECPLRPWACGRFRSKLSRQASIRGSQSEAIRIANEHMAVLRSKEALCEWRPFVRGYKT